MSARSDSTNTLILDTGIFEDRDTLLAAINHLDPSQSDRVNLNTEQMNDGDWDTIVARILSAKRVITV